MGDTSTTLSHWGAFEVTVDDGKVVGVEGVGIDPDPSPIGQHLLRAHDDRILAPAVRRSWIESGPFAAPDRRGLDSYVDVSWDEALDLAAQVVNTIRAEHGNQAIFGGSYGWASAGRFHHAPSQLKRFLNCVGGFVNSVGTYSHGAIEVVGPAIIGLDVQAFQRASTPITEIVERTELLVSFGGFPAQNSQIASGGDAVHWYRPELRKAAANGCRFVAITPSLGEFDAELGAEWLPIRPGTDAALMLGLAGELVARDLHATRFLQSRCSGADQLLAYLDGSFDGIVRNAEWAANICGLDAAAVSALALDVATTRSVVNAMWSTQRVEHGEQAVWSLIALGCVIGQLDQPGAGIAAGLGSLGSVSEARSAQYLPYLPQGPNPVDVRIPVARIADALLNPGDEYWFQGDRFRYPDIELVWWCGGNPFHHHQDLNRLDEAWKKPKAIIVNEPFWTSTAQRADIIFPATIGIERNDFGGTRTGPHLVSMEQAIEPPGEAQHDYLTFSALAAKLGCEDAFTEGRSIDEWLTWFYEMVQKGSPEIVDFDTLRERKIIERPDRVHPEPFGEFLRDPKTNPLSTPSGRIELGVEAERFGPDGSVHASWHEPAEWLGTATEDQLHLISPMPKHRLHAQFAFVDTHVEPVHINAEDAWRLQITHGDLVRVWNERGECFGQAQVVSTVRPGVLVMENGRILPQRDDDSGRLPDHGNVNILTSDRATSTWGQATAAHSCLVRIELHTPGTGELDVRATFEDLLGSSE